MSFVARLVEISYGDFDNKFVDGITLTSLCYSSQE